MMQITRLAPELSGLPLVLRPMLADPPLFTMGEFKHLTMSDILDANEVLNLREAIHESAMEQAERERAGAAMKANRR